MLLKTKYQFAVDRAKDARELARAARAAAQHQRMRAREEKDARVRASLIVAAHRCDREADECAKEALRLDVVAFLALWPETPAAMRRQAERT